MTPQEADAMLKYMRDRDLFDVMATVEQRQALGRAVWLLHADREAARGPDELPRWAGGRE